MTNIAIFASGSGTNAQRIVEYFSTRKDITIKLILVNRADAFVLERAKKLGVPSLIFGRSEFYDSDAILQRLMEEQIDWVILAGFLWKVPDSLLAKFPHRIINIHPALLPAYGGRGMYGHHVHQAVIDHQEKESGITIHFVNDQYDAGAIIFQAKCPVRENDTPDTLAARIHELEYNYFPVVIEQTIDQQ